MELPSERTSQRGCFTILQAEPHGWTRFSLRRASLAGRLTDVRPGVYVETDVFESLSERDEHLTRIVAEQLALGRYWFAARRSAAVVFNIPLIGKQPALPQLLAPSDLVAGKQAPRHRRIAALPVEQRRAVGGISVVSPARLFADVARDERFRNAVVVADALLGTGYPRELLVDCLAGMRQWPGVVAARAALNFADGLAESALESISRVAFHELSLPAPELQIEVWLGEELLGRVDMLWRFTHTIGEADGVAKFGATEAEREAAFRATKVRQERLEDVGFEVVRWGWEDAWRPQGVLDARLVRAFERGRSQVLDPRVRLAPTSVGDRLRRAA